MKIAVSSTGKDLTSEVDPCFGRAPYYVIVDSATMDFRALQNRRHDRLPQDAGIQAAQIVAAEKVDGVITGHCGPKARRVLQAAGIKVVTGTQGRITDVIHRFEKGEMAIAEAANDQIHRRRQRSRG